jgi:hypothetical protein
MAEGKIIVPGEEAISGRRHALVVSRGLGVHLVGQQQVHISRRSQVKTMPLGAAIPPLLPGEVCIAHRAEK